MGGTYVMRRGNAGDSMFGDQERGRNVQLISPEGLTVVKGHKAVGILACRMKPWKEKRQVAE